MREQLIQTIERHRADWCAERGQKSLWRTPLVGFADAGAPGFAALRQVVDASHFLPTDFLPEATIVVSYFLPFSRELADTNRREGATSPEWAEAYLTTNQLAIWLNDRLVEDLQAWGIRAAVPQGTGILSQERLWSRWSQRHVAYLAGLGTFGRNNLLISHAGSCGRYFSIVTDWKGIPDRPSTAEACLWKRDGSCGLRAARCPVHALGADGFDRHACFAVCMGNEARYPGADVCGKCDVGLPCSFGIPAGL
ncbi:MAG: epoxyqueuosine reductase [Oscillospiraceae bacterium]